MEMNLCGQMKEMVNNMGNLNGCIVDVEIYVEQIEGTIQINGYDTPDITETILFMGVSAEKSGQIFGVDIELYSGDYSTPRDVNTFEMNVLRILENPNELINRIIDEVLIPLYGDEINGYGLMMGFTEYPIFPNIEKWELEKVYRFVLVENKMNVNKDGQKNIAI